MLYNICPDCGAHLDYGEACSCNGHRLAPGKGERHTQKNTATPRCDRCKMAAKHYTPRGVGLEMVMVQTYTCEHPDAGSLAVYPYGTLDSPANCPLKK